MVELEGEVPPTLAAKTRLLVSELVSNAIRHGEGQVSGEVEMSPEKVRATVIDQGNGFATPPPDPSIAATTSAGKIGDARLIGINHVALEVSDLDEALEFYGAVFEFELRGRIGDQMAFLDMGDQFLALSAGRRQAPDEERHVGLVVDDKEATRRALDAAGAEVLPARGRDFRDPWGNHLQIVEYADIQFSKTPEVLRAMGLEKLEKSEAAHRELREKGVE